MRLANYFFADYLEKKEKVQHVVHKTFLTVLPDLIRISIIGLFLPFALWIFFPQLLIASVIWGLFGLGQMLMDLYRWYYDVWIITDRAILDIQSDGLFHVATTRIEYHLLEGISYSIAGFWRTILNYGDLMLEKAGSGAAVTLKDASRPALAETVILRCQESYMEGKNTQDHKTLRQLLSGMVREHVKEHGVPEEDEEDDDE